MHTFFTTPEPVSGAPRHLGGRLLTQIRVLDRCSSVFVVFLVCTVADKLSPENEKCHLTIFPRGREGGRGGCCFYQKSGVTPKSLTGTLNAF